VKGGIHHHNIRVHKDWVSLEPGELIPDVLRLRLARLARTSVEDLCGWEELSEIYVAPYDI
jgi:hypothetical protein